MATCGIAALVHMLVSRQEKRCSSNVHEIGTRLFKLEAHVGLPSDTCAIDACKEKLT